MSKPTESQIGVYFGIVSRVLPINDALLLAKSAEVNLDKKRLGDEIERLLDILDTKGYLEEYEIMKIWKED